MKNATAQFQTIILPKQSTIRTVVLFASSVLVLFSALYVFFVGKIVFDIVGRRVAESQMQTTESTVSTLEASYYGQLKSLDLARAESVGLTESHDTLYASRTSSVGSTVGFANER